MAGKKFDQTACYMNAVSFHHLQEQMFSFNEEQLESALQFVLCISNELQVKQTYPGEEKWFHVLKTLQGQKEKSSRKVLLQFCYII